MAKKTEHLPYPVTKEWCDRVRDALEQRGRGAQVRLSEFLTAELKSKVSTGHLSDVLSGKYQTSPLVGPIHEFFGWAPPLPPTASLDAGELVHGYQRMTKAQRAFLDHAREVLEGAHGSAAEERLTRSYGPGISQWNRLNPEDCSGSSDPPVIEAVHTTPGGVVTRTRRSRLRRYRWL